MDLFEVLAMSEDIQEAVVDEEVVESNMSDSENELVIMPVVYIKLGREVKKSRRFED